MAESCERKAYDDAIAGVAANDSSKLSETLLVGGRTTPGVVRIGNTVRRPPALNAEFVHFLLRHLECTGFDGAPRSLGRDEDGRDVLGWIEGNVPVELSAAHGDAVLTAAARLIRAYHDATAPLLTAPAAVAIGLDVVCHNDLSPCNFVFRAGLPVAVIDFDAAAPGTRAHDLGYAAWLWLDFGGAERAPLEQHRRLGVFLDAYGSGPTRAVVTAAILCRQDLLIAQGQRTGNAAMAQWAEQCRAWTFAYLSDGPDL